MFGYYSAKSDARTGHVKYSTPTGDVVNVTEVGSKPFSSWDDLVCVGEVCECVDTSDPKHVKFMEGILRKDKTCR